MVIRQLIFKSVQCTSVEAGVTVNSKCPTCGFDWAATTSLNEGTNENETFDFNNEITYSIPEHVDHATQQRCDCSGEDVKFYLAVHCVGEDLKVYVQRSDAEGASGIPVDWWRDQ
jgi:hypothetical protein